MSHQHQILLTIGGWPGINLNVFIIQYIIFHKDLQLYIATTLWWQQCHQWHDRLMHLNQTFCMLRMASPTTVHSSMSVNDPAYRFSRAAICLKHNRQTIWVRERETVKSLSPSSLDHHLRPSSKPIWYYTTAAQLQSHYIPTRSNILYIHSILNNHL